MKIRHRRRFRFTRSIYSGRVGIRVPYKEELKTGWYFCDFVDEAELGVQWREPAVGGTTQRGINEAQSL